MSALAGGRTGRRAAACALLFVLLGACGGQGGAAGEDRPDPRAAAHAWFPPCPPPVSGSPVGPEAAPAATPMPAVTLECLGEGGPVDLSAPRALPTVVTVWASWCQPCREELPAFQAYAERAAGTVRVIGVASGDTRTASLALAKDLGVRFPTLWDEDASLMKALGRSALPVTLFIDRAGRLVHLHNATPLTERTLSTLAGQHLGVTV